MSLKKYFLALAATVAMAASPLSHAALLGLTVNDPTIDVAAGGVIAYNAADGTVTISGTPQLFQQIDPFIFGEFVGTGPDDERLVTLQFKVDVYGNYIGGVDGPDLIVKGGIDTNFDGTVDYDGVLLEAEVTQFGFQDGANGGNDRFEVRLGSVTGLLAPFFVAKDLAVVVDGEPSDDYPAPFSGTFTSNFIGLAKVVLGSTEPPPAVACAVDVESSCSVNGGPYKSVCRIKVTRSPGHWEHVTHSCRGKTFRVYKFGLHGDPVPSWASRYAATNVSFKYVVKNTGTTPISSLQVIDSFDIGVSGVPSVLQPGQSVTLTRTEALRDGLTNAVIVTGESGSSMCMDKESVVVKDKVKFMRQHDYDKYKEKEARGDDRR